MIYTVTFNPAIDYVVRLRGALVPGGVNRSVGEDVQFGGKGVNVAHMLRTLGVDAAALGFVAGFTGEALESGLRAQGMDTRFIHLTRGMTRINAKVKAEQDGKIAEETEINGAGPVVDEAALGQLFAQLDALGAGDVLALSGSVSAGLGADTYARAMARVSGRGVRVAVDASGGLLRHALGERPFLVKPNREELGDFFGQEIKDEKALETCARRMQAMGAQNVLVSLAGDGALLLDAKGKAHRIACPKGTVVNSVGAGDSMLAGFLAGYLQTGDYDAALRLGTAAGSATAFSLGLADKKTIDALLAGM